MVQNGLKRLQMERGPLEAGKSVYGRDYPGTILGQCLDVNEKQESVLVFDVPDTSEDLGLNFQEQTIRLGKIEAIRNPLPTLTPSATLAPTDTPAPIATLAPTATLVPTATATQEPTLAPTDNSTMKPTKVPTKTPTLDSIGMDLRSALKVGDFTHKSSLDSSANGEVYVNSNGNVMIIIYDDRIGIGFSINASQSDMQQAWGVLMLTYPLSVSATISQEMSEHSQSGDLNFSGSVHGYDYRVGPSDDFSMIVVAISPLP
jgi:hypothetical protein